MRPLLILLAASLLALVFALSSAGAHRESAPAFGPVEPVRPPAFRAWCGEPTRLRLRRFEDGSAQLLCDGRLLARISVPG
jgi:hypothetical protein